MSIVDFKNELNLQTSEKHLYGVLDQINRDIQEQDAKITIRMLFNKLGFKSTRKYQDEYVDCYGWDKKGFRQLYQITTEIREVD